MDEFSEETKYWLLLNSNDVPIGIIINLNPDGTCTLIYTLTNPPTKHHYTSVYYNNCRKFTRTDYVTYKLLGYLD